MPNSLNVRKRKRDPKKDSKSRPKRYCNLPYMDERTTVWGQKWIESGRPVGSAPATNTTFDSKEGFYPTVAPYSDGNPLSNDVQSSMSDAASSRPLQLATPMAPRARNSSSSISPASSNLHTPSSSADSIKYHQRTNSTDPVVPNTLNPIIINDNDPILLSDNMPYSWSPTSQATSSASAQEFVDPYSSSMPDINYDIQDNGLRNLSLFSDFAPTVDYDISPANIFEPQDLTIDYGSMFTNASYDAPLPSQSTSTSTAHFPALRRYDFPPTSEMHLYSNAAFSSSDAYGYTSTPTPNAILDNRQTYIRGPPYPSTSSRTDRVRPYHCPYARANSHENDSELLHRSSLRPELHFSSTSMSAPAFQQALFPTPAYPETEFSNGVYEDQCGHHCRHYLPNFE